MNASVKIVALVVLAGCGWGCHKKDSQPTTPASAAAAPADRPPAPPGGPAPAPAEARTPAVQTFTRGRASVEILTWRNESALVATLDGQTFFRKSFFSESGHNGQYVTHVAWSPDATYFAFKLAGAGGHQPYRSPVKILKIDPRASTLIDAETVIRKSPGGSHILAVGHVRQPYLAWLSDSQLQVNVLDDLEKDQSAMYVIDVPAGKAHKRR